jgi:translation initiation factor 2B subunit (eIF-2B alpha/beta/delta family)
LFRVGAALQTTTSTSIQNSNLHPLVIQTGYWYATGQIRGGNARCRAMLRCYIRLIHDFSIPPPTTTKSSNKSLRYHMEHNILKIPFQYWTEFCRPHSVSMGNAYTFLKSAIATIECSLSTSSSSSSISTGSNRTIELTSWTDISKTLIEIINAYERERIDLPDIAIAEIACSKVLFSSMSLLQQHKPHQKNYFNSSIQQQQQQHTPQQYSTTTTTTPNGNSRRNLEGDVFLTFGDSEAIRAVFYQAVCQQQEQQVQVEGTTRTNIKFRVIVVDSGPLYEGKNMIQYLQQTLQIQQCSYCLLSSLTYVLKDVTKVIVGASALSSDGSVYGRVGTALIAIAATTKHIPVIVCCETYKISNRVFTGSITNNEIGNPNNICTIQQQHQQNDKGDGLTTNNSSNVHSLNLLYDLTPAQFVTGIVTELGILPPTSIAVLLREMSTSTPQDLRG